MTKTQRTRLQGCIPALITPFVRDGNRHNHAINYASLENLFQHIIRGGASGVVIAGSTGSDSVLSNDEQVDLVARAQKYFSNAAQDIAVIAGDGANSTHEAIDLARRMENEANVFLHLSKSPYYNKPSDEGIVEHFTDIANSIQGNLILYSVPGRTGGKGILPHVAERLSHHPRIIGIKEASGNIDRIRQTLDLTRNNDFFVISGDDGLTYDIMKAGGTGVISVAANVVPDLITKMANYLTLARNTNTQGNLSEQENLLAHASSLNSRLIPLYNALFPSNADLNPSPSPTPLHYAMERLGFSVGIPRKPYTHPSLSEINAIEQAMSGLRLPNYLPILPNGQFHYQPKNRSDNPLQLDIDLRPMILGQSAISRQGTELGQLSRSVLDYLNQQNTKQSPLQFAETGREYGHVSHMRITAPNTETIEKVKQGLSQLGVHLT